MITRLFTRDISLVFVASFFYMSCSFIATPLIAGFSESLGAGAVFMGIIGATFNTVALLSRPFVGNLADRLSRAHLSSIGAALMLVGSAGYVLAPAPAVVMLARIIHGLGMSCCSICMSTWIAGLLPREHTGAGMGLYGATNALGQAVAPALGIFLYERIGYRPVFLLGTALALGVLIVIHFVGDKGAPHPAAAKKRHRGLVAPNVVPVGLIIMLFAIPYCATQTYLVSYIAARAFCARWLVLPVLRHRAAGAAACLGGYVRQETVSVFPWRQRLLRPAELFPADDDAVESGAFGGGSLHGWRLRHHVFGLPVGGGAAW